ncbi:hypothetical protein [Leifsonia sp. SIMBA_070]|uniref:glycoside hydrolase family 38 N-terminal domain-containing protein n=2 Tax=Bacillati TaxID=1783272 RepID=UPI00397D4120
MPRIRRVLLLGHTHHDVGYTNSPRIIDGMHARIVREVLRLAAEDTAAPGAPDRFRWTFEVARPVLNFLRSALPEEIAQFRALTADGTIAVTGGYLNMTQLPDLAEFEAAYRSLHAIREAGLPIRTEQHGDVNGIAWGAADAMLDAGIERLVMALNPDHGRAPLEQPSAFWWEAPSGRRVFTLLSTHYGFGEEWGIVDGDVELAEQRILEFVERLDARTDYPFDTAIVHAGNDNRWPTALFTRIVRHWNERHPDRPTETATIDTAMDALAAQAEALAADAPDGLPVLRGEWADWWSHGHGSTAREVAVYREARRFARSARAAFGLAARRGEGDPALATVLGYRRGPVRLRGEAELAEAFERVDEELLLFGEHTWGSWETYSKPHSHFSHSHGNAKAGFAYGAWDLARDLNVEELHRLAASGWDPAADLVPVEGVLVANLDDRPRREPVEAEVDGSRRVTIVAEVPARSVVVLPAPAPLPSPREGTTVEAGRFRAAVDPNRGGVVSLVDLTTGRELIDTTAAHGLGAIVSEYVTEAGRSHAMFGNPKNFNPSFPGPEFEQRHGRADALPGVTETETFARIHWVSELPGELSATHTLTLYRDLADIDLDVRIAKPEKFGPESIFVTFPFAVAAPQFLLETAGAVFAADTEQLPDTSKDWYSIQHAVGVRNDAADAAILWGTVDAPLVQLGGFHTGEWARTLDAPSGHINSWVMNNLHFTNFQARQEFTGTLHYRFRPAVAAELREAVARYGADLALPLQARAYAGPLGRERSRTVGPGAHGVPHPRRR